MSGPIKKIWNVVSSVLVALVVLLALLLVGARVVGIRLYHANHRCSLYYPYKSRRI